MRLTTPLSLVLSAPSVFAAAALNERKVDIFVWPLSASSSQSLAQIAYNTSSATIKSYQTPSIPSDESVVRIGFYHPDSPSIWSGVATSASNFAEGKEKKLQLLLNSEGAVYHVGFVTPNQPISSRGSSTVDGLSVEVVPMRPGPVVHVNKPIVLDAEGKLADKEPEKTFLQKYWWAIGIFLVLQLVMAGGKE